jgi:glutathione S-transferase
MVSGTILTSHSMRSILTQALTVIDYGLLLANPTLDPLCYLERLAQINSRGFLMLQVYHFGRAGQLPDASPFCVKLLTYLKMANIDFETIRGSHNLKKNPKGKMPFIIHNGTILGDSSLIIEYLKKTFGDTVDGHLTEDEQRQGLFIQRMIEDHLYWVMVYSRWADETMFPTTKKVFFHRLSGPMRFIVPIVARKRAVKLVKAQGIARHDRDTIYQMGLDDLKALTPLFKVDQYLFGDKPTSYDALAFGAFANIIWMVHDTPLKAYLMEQPHIEAYCQRIRDKYWPDLKP